MSLRRRFGAAFTLVLACGTSGCVDDTWAFVMFHTMGNAALPGSVSFAFLYDACPAGIWTACSTEWPEYNTDVEIADPFVVEEAPTSSEWGSEIDWLRGAALRAKAPGVAEVTLTARFDDGTTRSATGTLEVIAPEFMTIEPRIDALPDCADPGEFLSGPEPTQERVTVLVGDEVPLFVRPWGRNQRGAEVSVNGAFDVPPLVRGLGVTHTLTKTTEGWETVLAQTHSIIVHAPGEVIIESALETARLYPLMVKAVAESTLRGVEPLFPFAAPLRVGRNQLVRAVPRDDEGVFCGGARFKERLTVTSLTPEYCLLGSSLYDSGVASSFTPRDAEFYIVPIAPGMCRYRMSLPDLPRRARSVHEARVYTADDPLNDGEW